MGRYMLWKLVTLMTVASIFCGILWSKHTQKRDNSLASAMGQDSRREDEHHRHAEPGTHERRA